MRAASGGALARATGDGPEPLPISNPLLSSVSLISSEISHAFFSQNLRSDIGGRGPSHQSHVLERRDTYGQAQVCSKGH